MRKDGDTQKVYQIHEENGMVYLEEHKEGDEEETYIMVVPKIV